MMPPTLSANDDSARSPRPSPPARRTRHVALAAMIFACVGASLACHKSDVRPGVRRTATGKFVNYYPAPSEDVRAAASATLQDLGLMMLRDEQLSGDGRFVVEGRNAQDTRVTMEFTRSTPQATMGTIKIQPGWNEGLALSVHDKINARLRGDDGRYRSR